MKNLATILEEHILKPTKAQGTRWIDHRLKALKALDRNLRTLRMLFEEWGSQERSDVTDDVSAKMRGYLKIPKTPKFSFYVAAYLDITEELSLLSRSFQADDLPISSVRANVEVAAISLRFSWQIQDLMSVKYPRTFWRAPQMMTFQGSTRTLRRPLKMSWPAL